MPITFEEKVISGTINGSSITYTKSIPHRHEYAAQLKWSGTTISGSAKLQGSINGTDFVDVSNSEITISANSGNELWAVGGINYKWLRIVCTSSSGDITFEVWLIIKKPSQIS
jgi:hypothetical protein